MRFRTGTGDRFRLELYCFSFRLFYQRRYANTRVSAKIRYIRFDILYERDVIRNVTLRAGVQDAEDADSGVLNFIAFPSVVWAEKQC